MFNILGHARAGSDSSLGRGKKNQFGFLNPPSAGWKGFPVGTDTLLPRERALWSKEFVPACWGGQHTSKTAAGRKEKVTYKKPKLRKEAQRGGMMAVLSGASNPKTSVLSVREGGDLITHKVIKSILFALCPVSSNRCMRNLQLLSCCLGLSAQGAFTSHSSLPG